MTKYLLQAALVALLTAPLAAHAAAAERQAEVAKLGADEHQHGAMKEQ